MSNVINVDFTPCDQSIEEMMAQAVSRYAELSPFGVQLVANIGDTDVLSDSGHVYVKVDGETVLSFSRTGEHGLADLVKALESQIK